MRRPPLDPVTERFRTLAGGRIDRERRVTFTFDGRRLTGHPGDSLASALLANGVHLVARSFKYHRPRGILSAGPEEPNALVTIRRGWKRSTPNLRATEVEVYEGLDAISQNRWPSLAHDAAGVNDRLGGLFPAGFYYKTFMGGRLDGGHKAWHRLYEPAIRRMAGLGRAPPDADPDRYASRYAHTDVLIVGGGPAGIMAALGAAETGARVMLADEQAEPGGSLLAEVHAQIDGTPAGQWLADALGRLRQAQNVTVLPRTTVFGAYPDHFFGLAERLGDHLADPPLGLPRERLWQVRARQVVIASGAIERPLVFPGNDRPGVMLAGAVRTYLNRYGVLAGTRAVVVAAADYAYPLAVELAHHGIRVTSVVDLRRSEAIGSAAREGAAKAGIAIAEGATITATHGRHRVTGIDVAVPGERAQRVPTDLVLMAGGFTPTLHLVSQLRGRLEWRDAIGAFLSEDRPANVHVAGAARGTQSLADALGQGHAAGRAASGASLPGGRAVPAVGGDLFADTGWFAPLPETSRMPRKGRAFVDFQNDVTAGDLDLASREGFRSVEHVKRYTTTGMATDQGKTSNVNTLGLVAAATGRSVGAVGQTTFRAPYTPVTFGTLAGEARGALLDPVRRTPIDAIARAAGAVFEDVGQWQRARYFPQGSEGIHAAVARECRAVRTSLGVFDASTLGKIEVVGPDAARFLDRLYPNALEGLAVGRCRYGVMLSEAGFVMDDGIVARLATDRFHVTTTTGGAARVLAHMEDYLQTEFTDCRCWLTSVTEQWAVIAAQGPRSRDLLAPLIADADLSPSALPHMGLKDGTILGARMRLFRVSFTGELGFEVNVPATEAPRIWQRILADAEALGGCAYGTEAMHVLRAEKGYIIVGQESDGTVTPGDLGLPTGAAKADFVGKRSLTRPDMTRPDRLQLVGLDCAEPGGLPEEGSQITATSTPEAGTPALGHVTSSYPSATLGRPVVLALLQGGRGRHGETLFVMGSGGAQRVLVVDPVFYDRQGERLDG